jgi:hypothetical protein
MFDMATEQLEHQITSLAGQLAATTCQWLRLVGEFDRLEAWASWGCRSAAHWLSWQCGLSLRTGREHVRIAHALERLPLTTSTFERGELTYSKVKALTRIATPDNEGELVEFARTATASQLDRTVSAYLRSTKDPNQSHDERYLYVESVDDMVEVRGRVTPEVGALIESAIEAALRELPVEDGPAGPPSIAQRRADALALICESFLAHGAEARPSAEATTVVVHVDADAVGSAELEDGTPLHPETARRLGCDASAVAIIERDGIPIGVGRKTRAPDVFTRRAVVARDRRCRWPGCSEARFVQVHHRWHWTQGGPTDLDNLVLLCWWHHHALHEGGFTIDDRCRALRPDGTEVLDPTPAPAEPLTPTVRADATMAGWAGEKFDLGLAVDALWGLCVPASGHDEPDRAAGGGG